jgi:hypothetical protein
MIESENAPAVDPKSTRLWQSYFGPRPEKFVYYGISVVAAYALLRSTFYAAFKPLWFDEILTSVVSRQGSLSRIQAALAQGIDGNPPAFYLVEHWAASLVSNEHIGLRLLSILGFACTLLFVWTFVKTRHGSSVALISSALLLVTPLFTLYAQEARPYSLVVASIALAMVCYQRAPRPLWIVGLALSLTLAALLHYYVLLSFAPFFLAELAFLYFAKRIRFTVWLALLVPLLPVAISLPRLIWMKQNWGPHFWYGAALSDVSAAYGDYFRVGSLWGVALFGITLLMLFSSLSSLLSKRDSTDRLLPALLAERTLSAGLIVLPLLGFAVAKASHGPFTERYLLATILGFASASAFPLSKASPAAFQTVATLLLLALCSQELGFWKSVKNRQTPASIIAPLVELAKVPNYADLPVVFSDAGIYVEIWHYAPPGLFRRAVALPDPEGAVTYSDTDTVDKLVLALRPYAPPGIHHFDEFVAANPRFLLYSNGSRADWWPARLAHDGYRVQRVYSGAPNVAYVVDSPAQEKAAADTMLR